MKHPEQRLHNVVADFLNVALPRDAWWTTVGHGGFALDARTGARMKRAGMKAGVPDILVVYRGRAHFLELKAPKGKPSAEQRKVAHDLGQAGATWSVVRSIEDVIQELMICGVPVYARAA